MRKVSIIAMLVALWASPGWGAPAAVPYFGYLAFEDTDVPFYGQLDTVEVELFATATPPAGTTPVWSGSYVDVEVAGGMLHFVMSSAAGEPLDAATFGEHPGGLWMRVILDGEAMAPLQAVQSVPYALHAGHAALAQEAVVAQNAEQLGGVDAVHYVVQSAQGDADFAGNVGVGGGLQAGSVSSEGSVQLGNDASPCTPDKAGALRWGGSYVEVCDGSDWGPIAQLPENGANQAQAARSCLDILQDGFSIGDGTYWIDPNGGLADDAFPVFCDMTTDGGGWIRIDYAQPLTYQQHFSGGDAVRWLPNDFTFLLSDQQIQAIQEVTTEGRQTYVGLCNHVIHYHYADEGTYEFAFGFRFFDGSETVRGLASYAPVDITVAQDGCATNGGEEGDPALATRFEIRDPRLPVLNVISRDNGDTNEKFGSPLTSNPAWLR